MALINNNLNNGLLYLNFNQDYGIIKNKLIRLFCMCY